MEAGVVDAAFDAPMDASPPIVEWFLYLSNESGTMEVWAARADATETRVLLTEFSDDPYTPSAARGINWIRVSPDHRRIAFVGSRNAAGEWLNGGSVYLMDPDGGNLRHLVETATDPNSTFSIAWEGDGTHLLYTKWSPCTDDIHRLDVDTGEDEVLIDADTIRADARPNPRDDQDLLVFQQMCGEGGTLYRYDALSGDSAPVPGIIGAEARRAEWMPDGASFVFATGDFIYQHSPDDGTSIPVWERLRGSLLFSARPIRDGAELLAVASADGAPMGLGTVRDGVVTEYPLPIVDAVGVDWGRLGEIDCDGDGLGNGIDPDSGC